MQNHIRFYSNHKLIIFKVLHLLLDLTKTQNIIWLFFDNLILFTYF